MLQRGLFSLLILLSVSGTIPAQVSSQTLTSTLLRAWLAAFDSGDSVQLVTFWKQYGSDDSEARASRDLGLYGMTGGFTILKVIEDNGSTLVVSMKDAHGGFAEITLELASTDPPIVKSINGHPVPPPKAERSPASSDSELSKETVDHANALFARDEFSGAILIAHNGAPILQQAWGLADRDKKMSNSVDTQFCIGSMNKMFTAVAILQLVEAHKLSLDGALADYWPNYPNRDLATHVTVRQLLNHTAGTGDIFTPEYEAHRATTRTLADYVKLFGTRQAAFEPGSRFEYSNYGYILLGRLIELVSGETYSSYIAKHIDAPAGMRHTSLNGIGGTDVATGYTRSGGRLTSNASTLPTAGTSAGGGYSTVGDLFLFSKALREGKMLGPQLLKEATSDQSHHAYGYGFNVSADGSFGHGGGAPGINGELRILANGYTVVVLENLDPPSATEVANFIAARVPGTFEE